MSKDKWKASLPHLEQHEAMQWHTNCRGLQEPIWRVTPPQMFMGGQWEALWERPQEEGSPRNCNL